MTDLVWRARNAARRLLAGLPPRHGPPSPEAPTAVYRTLGSIYHFAAGRLAETAGAGVLDWGCGTGFGAARLAAAGAGPVVGVDPDGAALRYARRRFGGEGIDFRAAPLDAPLSALPDRSVSRLVAVDTLSRLADPEETVPRVVGALVPGGVLIASLPPILDGPTLELHRGEHPEAAGLFLWDWADLLGGCFGELRLYAHLSPAPTGSAGSAESAGPDGFDLASPRPSDLDETAFRFEELPVADLDNVGTLGAVFVASRPRLARLV